MSITFDDGNTRFKDGSTPLNDTNLNKLLDLALQKISSRDRNIADIAVISRVDFSTLSEKNSNTLYFTFRRPLADYSWSEIAQISESGQAQERFIVGEKKDILLNTGEIITVKILGFNHDFIWDTANLFHTDKRAGVTFGMSNLLTEQQQRPEESGPFNQNSWFDVMFSQLPLELQAVIKDINKTRATEAFDGIIPILLPKKLFLFSAREIGNLVSLSNNPMLGIPPLTDEGTQYEYWRTVRDGTFPADRIKRLSNGAGVPNMWWLRAPIEGRNNVVSSVFNADGFFTTHLTHLLGGICLGFCI